MAKRPLIEAEKREAVGKRAMKHLRGEGKIPAVMYGPGVPTETLAVNAEAFQAIVDARARTVEVKIGGSVQPAVIKEVQYDHLGSDIYHVDFERINLEEVVRVSVPVETHGTAKGTKNGGILEVLHRHVTVECAAGDVPNEIVVEVGDLDIGQSVAVSGLPVPAGVKVIDEASTMVVIVLAPRAAEAVAAAGAEAEAELAEPEVIGGRKKEEEEEEEA